jgi:hypothetical protein
MRASLFPRQPLPGGEPSRVTTKDCISDDLRRTHLPASPGTKEKARVRDQHRHRCRVASENLSGVRATISFSKSVRDY